MNPPPDAKIRPLLEWLLEKYPDTPKKRAKQWITAGRVSVNGVIIRQPNQPIPDPQRALELQDRRSTSVTLEREWRIHARLGLLYIDASLAVVTPLPPDALVFDPPWSAARRIRDHLLLRVRADAPESDGSLHR